MFEYKTMTGDGLPSEAQLDVLAEEGWELVQIIPFAKGMKEIREGEVAMYLRRVRKVTIQ